MIKKTNEPLIQQTEFASTQTWLEEPSITQTEQSEKQQTKTKRKKRAFILIGTITIFVAGMLLLINLFSQPPKQVVNVIEPTPTPTVTPVLKPLLSRILEARERVQSIDIGEAELALPQVELDLVLDEPKQ